jgi:hypothetical protein
VFSFQLQFSVLTLFKTKASRYNFDEKSKSLDVTKPSKNILSVRVNFEERKKRKICIENFLKHIIMKKLFLVLLFIIAFSCGNKKEIKQLADVSCGQCNFELESEDDCSLAIKINNKAYFIDGFGIDDFGDAHDENTGFCNVVRKAAVVGEVVNGRFVASTIKLVE